MKKILFAACITMLAICSSCSTNEQLYTLDYIPVESDDEHFFIDVKTGEKADGSGVYQVATYFINGFAVVSDDGEGYYFIDEDFDKLSNSEVYTYLTYFNDGVAYAVKKCGHIQAINTSGVVIFTLEDAESAAAFNDGVSVYETIDGEYGLINTEGEVLIQPGKYDELSSECKDGLLPVAVQTKRGLRWGAATYDGEEVIPCEYEELQCLNADEFLVYEDGCWGVVDRKNKEIVPIEYKEVHKQEDGNYLVKKYIESRSESRYGWLDSDGKEMISFDYSKAGLFSCKGLFSCMGLFSSAGLAPAMSSFSDEYGFINGKGEWVIHPAFETAYSYNDENVAVVENSRGKWGLIDDEGEYLVNARYDEIYYIGEGLYYVRKDGMDGLIDKHGETIVKLSDEIEYSDPMSYVRSLNGVESDYLDIEDVVNKMVADSKQLVVDRLSLSSYEDKFNKTLNSYGWSELASYENRYYTCTVEAYVDYEWSYYYDYKSYYITKLRARYYVKSDAFERHRDDVVNKFSNVILESDSKNLSIIPSCSGEVDSSYREITLTVRPKYGVIR